MSIEINPKRLGGGPWNEGYALDLHKRSSVFLGYNEYGRPRFDTTRSPVGELLFQLKYRDDRRALPHLVDAVETFWKKMWHPAVDAIVPVPPSVVREDQPVMLLAAAISERLIIPLCTSCLAKVKQTPQLKDIVEYDRRTEALKDAFAVTSAETQGKSLLLFDDLFGSGATVRAIVQCLKSEGMAKAVYLLTLTTK